MQPVVAGDMPLVVLADRASDIEQVLKLKEDFGLKLVIASGAESWIVADKLAAADVPVILDPLTNLPETFSSLNSNSSFSPSYIFGENVLLLKSKTSKTLPKPPSSAC